MMVTHVMPILLLIGSLAAGVTCFTWSGGPETNSTVRPCPGDNVTLDWRFSLTDKDHLLSVQWFLAQDDKNQKTVATASRSGSFLKFPDIKTRVEFLPPAGLRLYNVSTRDLGTYTVYVVLFHPGGPDIRQRSVTLALPEKPYLSEERLVASVEPGTVTVNGTSHARLACGTILNHQDPNFSVVWKTPAGQTVPSSGQRDGVFHLLLANPVQGGAYHCHLHGVTSLTCRHNGTQSSAGRVDVDGLQTRLMVLEAGAKRNDRQLLQKDVFRDNLWLAVGNLEVALEREANESLEVRAAMDGLRAKTQSLDTVDTELRNLTAEHEQQVNTLDKRLDTVVTELSNVTTELKSVAARQEQGLDKVDARLTAAEEERHTLTADSREQSQQLQDLTARVDQLTDTVGRQERVITNLTAYLEKLSKDDKVRSPANCLDVQQYDDKDGVHTLTVSGRQMTVFCDQTTAGGGWTVIQRREDGSVDFYRPWQEYREGFRRVDHEHWLGLENIHILTKNRAHELRVDMWAFDGSTAFAQYERFIVEGENENYRLIVYDYDKTSTAGNSLAIHNNMAFSTPDRDNDNHSTGSCTETWHGAWWYNRCHRANLNGRYKTSEVDGADGICWFTWKNNYTSLKKVEMKIRPV